MLFFNPLPLVPKHHLKTYRVLRGLLVFAFVGAGFFFTYRSLFPSQHFLFSFENPDSEKNSFEDSFDKDSDVRKGKIEGDKPIHTYAGTVGTFSSAHIELVLEDDSPDPQKPIEASLLKSYRSFFFPEGEPVTSMPKDRAFLIGGTPFLFSDGKMFPFVGDAATLSRFPKETLTATGKEILDTFPAQEDYIGFRRGSLLSDAEGVYAIGEDDKAHPIGSVNIFETLGFSWNDVKPVNEEELGFHKRGRILLYSAAQPDGTLFSDPTTGNLFVVEAGTKRRVTDADTAEFLRKLSTPIGVTEKATSSPASCVLTRKVISWRPTYACDIPLKAFESFPGSSFELTLSAGSQLHVATLTTTFKTEPNRRNLSLFINQIRDRFEVVYGR